jgi:predicted nucleic acid-binding protein
MTRNVLLDTNVLIAVFDGDTANAEHQEIQKAFEELTSCSDDAINFVTTPLVSYEFLRNLNHELTPEETAVFNEYERIEINHKHARIAAQVYELDTLQGSYPIDLSHCSRIEFDDLEITSKDYKHSFDIFHCVCAEFEELEIISYDKRFPKVKRLIQDPNIQQLIQKLRGS